MNLSEIMINQELSKIFYQIAEFLEIEGVAFKPQAYQKAGLVLETLEEDVFDIYNQKGKKGLLEIPGIGESIADKIEEYIKKGKIKYYEELKKRTPVRLDELMGIEGLGPKKIKVLYQKLGIKNLKELEKAAKEHKIAPLFGFGSKTERNILEGIQFLRKSKGRFLLGEILPFAKEIEKKLKKMKEVKKVSLAGSIRRRKETIGDVDFLVVSNQPQKVMDFFCSLKGIEKIWGKGKTKSSVRMRQGFDMDIRVVPARCYGAALQYFTGSKEHNIALRRIAIEKGCKLSEYGLFKGGKMVAGKEEEEIYRFLGMEYPAPELRTDSGEIEAALSHKLPRVIEYDEIKGDLHCHIKWAGKFDGGANTIEEMTEMAIEMGYEYIGIASHTKFLKIEHGLNEQQLKERNKEIDKINQKLKKRGEKIKILKGCEANILNNGSVDIKDDCLRKLDFVIAGIHSNFKMSKKRMTERIIRAMKNPNIDIISHPTGRLIKRREGYEIDIEKIMKAARETKTILEINAYPERLDLNDTNIRLAKEIGVKMVINTDAHHKDQMKFIEFGIAQARRGWAEKSDIINTRSLAELIKYLK